MKKTIQTVALVLLPLVGPLGSSLHAQTLYYDFNTTGSSQVSAGSDHLALTTVNSGFAPTNYVNSTPAGPSGNAGDTALDLAGVSTAGGAQAGTLGTAVSGDTNLTGLSSFTISGWVSNLTANGNLQTLFALNNVNVPVVQLSFYGTAGGASRLQFATNNSLGVVSNFGGTGTALTIPSASSTWDFVAVTYNGTTGGVTFYEGAAGDTSLGSYTPTGTQATPTSSSITSLYIGNQYYNLGSSGSVNGNLDDVGLYNTALTSGQLATVFSSEGPQAAPEPSTFGLFILGGLAMLCWRVRKLRMTS
jgi:hypothetical protein